MQARITAKYLPMIKPFIAKNDGRWHLNALQIKPHPHGGITLCATNGHAICVIYDKQGSCNDTYIVEIPTTIYRACRKHADWLTIEGDMANVIFSEDKFEEVATSEIELIDGRFPLWENLFKLTATPNTHLYFNPKLFKKLKPALKALPGTGINLFSTGALTAPILVQLEGLPEMQCLIMPLRGSKATGAIPAWLSDLQASDDATTAD